MARRKSDSEAPEADATQDDEAAAKAEVEERIEGGKQGMPTHRTGRQAAV